MLITAKKKKKLPSWQQVDCCLTPQLDNLALSSRHVKLATKIRGLLLFSLEARTAEFMTDISSARFEYQWKDACMHAQLLSHVQLFVTHQTPLSMGFPLKEYWSRLLSPPPGDLPDSGIERASPALADRFFTTAPPGKPKGKMDEPQTKGVHEKFCGLWTQAELQSRKM